MSTSKSMSRRQMVVTLGVGLAAAAVPGVGAQAQRPAQSAAQPGNRPATDTKNPVYPKGGQMQVKKFNVTVHRFDPSNNGHVEEFVLPVDCPDEEHAASAVLSNLIAWTPKLDGGKVLPIAFQCIAVTERAG